MKTQLITLTCILTSLLNGQIDSINRYDDKGKKTGHWVKYLDANLNPTDSSTSYFYGYEYYDHGKAIFKFYNNKFRKKYKHAAFSSINLPGNPIPLDGIFKYYEIKDTLPGIIEEYKGGYPVKLIEFHHCEFHPYGPATIIDYSKRHKNKIGTFYIEYRNGSQTKIDKFWYIKEDGKWKNIRFD